MPVMLQDRLAFDFQSARRIDADGHMHVEVSNISIAAVNEYLGSEIPGAAAFGLQPDKIYRLLRDPGELQRAADTFNNKPLLTIHKAQNAATHDHELTVGSVSGPRFEPPYLKATLVVWDGDAIAGIQSGRQKELSSSYRYEYDPTPGTYEGQPYDGRMVNIVGNHVALVEKGRAGASVVVGDSLPTPKGQPMTVSRKAALTAYADEAKLAADAALAKVTANPSYKPVAAKFAKDAKIAKAAADAAKDDEDMSDDADLDDETEAEKAARLAKEAKDKKAKDAKAAKDKAAKDKAGKGKMAGDEDPDPDEEVDGDDPSTEKVKALAAKVEALEDEIESAMDNGAKVAEAKFKALREAERAVRPEFGDLALDSAEAIYKHALTQRGVTLKEVPASAYGAIYAALPKPNATPPRMAADSAGNADFYKRWPMLAPKTPATAK